MDISDVKFAKSGDVNLAYQRYGTGPDLVLIPPLISNVELGWEQEVYRRVREHIGRYVRVLEFDKRGIGSSDDSRATRRWRNASATSRPSWTRRESSAPVFWGSRRAA